MHKITVLDEFNYYQSLGETDGVALVYYTSPDCGACRYLRRVLEEYLCLYDDLTVFEVEAVTSLALVNEFNIFHLPCMFLYQQGEYHCELQAEALPKHIYEAIKKALL